jgi:hypothetical protein
MYAIIFVDDCNSGFDITSLKYPHCSYSYRSGINATAVALFVYDSIAHYQVDATFP